VIGPLFPVKSKGTGLDLIIVEHIVEVHGGTIDVESTLVEVATNMRLPNNVSGNKIQ